MAQNLTFLVGEKLVEKDGKLTLTAAAKLNRVAILSVDAVPKNTVPNWTVWGGTGSTSAANSYTAAAISNPPTQAEVQAIANSLQEVSRGFKSLIDDLIANGAIM
jgi:uncharacterized protein (UPF0333 family)